MLSPAEGCLLDEVTKSLMQTGLRQPVPQLKAAGERGELVEVLSGLFDLARQPALA